MYAPLFQVIFRNRGSTRRVVHEAALHDAEVTWRGAKVAVTRPGFELSGQEANRGALAAAADLGGSDYAGVAWFRSVVSDDPRRMVGFLFNQCPLSSVKQYGTP